MCDGLVITINESIEIPSPPPTVWSVLSDPRQVVSCIGGSELDELNDDGTFSARLAVKFGAIRVVFKARGELQRQDEEHTGRLSARGSDVQGATRVGGQAEFAVHPSVTDANQSLVSLKGEIDISGKLAPLVSAGATVVIGRMTREFADCLTARCAPAVSDTTVSTAPVPAGRPGRSGRAARVFALLRRLLQRPRNSGGRASSPGRSEG